MSKVSIVLWDVDGTLTDYAVPVKQFVRSCLVATDIPLGLPDAGSFHEAEQFRKKWELTWRTPNDEKEGFIEFARILLKGTGVSNDKVLRFAGSVAMYFDLCTVVSGVQALLDELRDAGIVQGVVSNWPPSLRRFLEHHSLNTYFRVVVGSGEYGVAKPDTGIFIRALAELGVSAGECVYVGDNPENDISPAKGIGMQAIHFDPRRRHNIADVRDACELRVRLLSVLGLAEIV